MICKPKDYSKDKLGGFILNDDMYQENIIITNERLTLNSENFVFLDKNIIYDTINNLSSIGYKINTDVFNFIIKNNDNFNLTLINSKHILEEKKGKLGKRQLFELTSFFFKSKCLNVLLMKIF